MNREETHRAEKESNGQAAKGTATGTYGYDRHRAGPQRISKERTSAETEKKSYAANGNGMAPNRYDRTRNGKAKIPRRRNPAERKIIWKT